MLVCEQIRAARAFVGWSARELAERAGLHITTVQRMETGSGPVIGNISSIRRVQEALEAAGAEFIDDIEKPGVSLHAAVKAPSKVAYTDG
jgi:transcriptional regulator with XRE-family HTH domain